MTRQDVEDLRHTLGLDRPLHEQYLRWMSRIVLHGDLGWSWEWRRPVAEVIGERLAAHARAGLLHADLHVCGRAADRHLFRRAAVFPERPSVLGPRLYRAGDPELPARDHLHVSGPAMVRPERRRAVLAALRRRALELGQAVGPARASLDTRGGAGHVGHGLSGALHARGAARRAREDVCGGGARRRPVADAPAASNIPCAWRSIRSSARSAGG